MITVSNLSLSYGKKSVLQDISFQAKCGEKVAIVGKNGCGKTTLMQILAGVMKPNSGSIMYFNENPLKKKNVFRELCGYVPQDNPLIEELSVKDNLKLWSAVSGKKDNELISFFDLEEMLKLPINKLSGGMKRRISIACALVGWPPILLMDEPTTALDLHYKDSIHSIMDKYRKMNGIILMTTHDETEILGCHRCLVIHEGRVVELEKKDITINKIKEYMGI